jgi:hypothetical protein
VPSGIVGFDGPTTKDTNCAGVTVRVAVPLMPPLDIVITVWPADTVLASPSVPGELLIVPTSPLDELQCPDCVTSRLLPSVNVPTAVNCCCIPNGIEVADGVTAMETRAAGVTVTAAEPEIPPNVAEIFALPMPVLLPSPTLSTVATAGASEAQVLDAVKSWVVLSVKVPVAVNCCLVPRANTGLAGVTAIETRDAVLTVRTVDPEIPAEDAAIVAVPVPTLLAKPSLPAILLIVLTAALSELHCTILVTS